jgi:hypothetical protein
MPITDMLAGTVWIRVVAHHLPIKEDYPAKFPSLLCAGRRRYRRHIRALVSC